jgi:hypothetical protein
LEAATTIGGDAGIGDLGTEGHDTEHNAPLLKAETKSARKE